MSQETNPDYYARWAIEPIDFIEATELSFNSGNVVKYLVRCGHKGTESALLDLQKAAYYLHREIALVEKEMATISTGAPHNDKTA